MKFDRAKSNYIIEHHIILFELTKGLFLLSFSSLSRSIFLGSFSFHRQPLPHPRRRFGFSIPHFFSPRSAPEIKKITWLFPLSSFCHHEPQTLFETAKWFSHNSLIRCRSWLRVIRDVSPTTVSPTSALSEFSLISLIRRTSTEERFMKEPSERDDCTGWIVEHTEGSMPKEKWFRSDTDSRSYWGYREYFR